MEPKLETEMKKLYRGSIYLGHHRGVEIYGREFRGAKRYMAKHLGAWKRLDELTAEIDKLLDAGDYGPDGWNNYAGRV